MLTPLIKYVGPQQELDDVIRPYLTQ